MEKISGIIPASSRQVWTFGETEKPRRDFEFPESRAESLSQIRKPDFAPGFEAAPGKQPVADHDFSKGVKLDVTA